MASVWSVRLRQGVHGECEVIIKLDGSIARFCHKADSVCFTLFAFLSNIVCGSDRLSHSDSNRREHRGTIIHGIDVGASGNDHRLEEDDDVQEEGQKGKTDPTILDAALRLLSGDIRRHDGTKGQMATDPVFRFAYRQYATEHWRFRGCAGFSSRVPVLGETRTTIDKSHSRR